MDRYVPSLERACSVKHPARTSWLGFHLDLVDIKRLGGAKKCISISLKPEIRTEGAWIDRPLIGPRRCEHNPVHSYAMLVTVGRGQNFLSA